MLTRRQKQVLDFIKSFKEKRGYSPSLEEVKDYLRLSSVSTAHHHVKSLQEAGFLHKEYNQPRSVSFNEEVETLEVPLLGKITAGQPIAAIEIPDETILVTKSDLGKTGKHYALRVQGNSMIGEGIFDGDIVVIREQQSADDGQTVVAIIDDNEATLKKIYREKDRFRLQPSNPTLFPIYRKEVEIRGVVVKIIRSFDKPVEKEFAKDTKFVRHIDYSWDFKGENTKSYVHGFHTYPAMFIPQVAKRLILAFSNIGETICDIFCGSGTALVESRLNSRNSIGIDLNPLAIFLAKVKTTEINPSILTKEYFDLLDKIQRIKHFDVERPNFNNINFWFKENVILDLARIKKAILGIKEDNVKNFFLVSFSDAVRIVSNKKSGEFKLVRIPKEKLEVYNPNTMDVFKKRSEANINGMTEFFKDVDKKTWSKVILGDSSKDNGILDESIDCIVTSPPYGDSRTTVAYGQFSRLSSQWIDIYDDPNSASSIDNDLLGGKPVKVLEHNLESFYLTESLEKVGNQDISRAKDVLSFFLGLNDCLKRAHKILKANKYFCIVIGNRSVKQVRIPTDFIIAELAEKVGFDCEDIIVRNIPDKRMPSRNSPTNVSGELEDTMTKESIVILRKT